MTDLTREEIEAVKAALDRSEVGTHRFSVSASDIRTVFHAAPALLDMAKRAVEREQMLKGFMAEANGLPRDTKFSSLEELYHKAGKLTRDELEAALAAANERIAGLVEALKEADPYGAILQRVSVRRAARLLSTQAEGGADV